MTSPPPADPKKWQTYEDDVEDHLRDKLGNRLYRWLERMDRLEKEKESASQASV